MSRAYSYTEQVLNIMLFSVSSFLPLFMSQGQGVVFTNCPAPEEPRVLMDETLVAAAHERIVKFQHRLPNYGGRDFTNAKLADLLRRR